MYLTVKYDPGFKKGEKVNFQGNPFHCFLRKMEIPFPEKQHSYQAIDREEERADFRKMLWS